MIAVHEAVHERAIVNSFNRFVAVSYGIMIYVTITQ